MQNAFLIFPPPFFTNFEISHAGPPGPDLCLDPPVEWFAEDGTTGTIRPFIFPLPGPNENWKAAILAAAVIQVETDQLDLNITMGIFPDYSVLAP